MGLLDQQGPPSSRSLHNYIGIYGDPGIGKTVLACRAPYPVLHIECERNASLSLRNHPELDGRVAVIQNDLIKGLPTMESLNKELRHQAVQEFQTVVVDSLSALSDRNLMKIKAEKPDIKDPRQYYNQNKEEMYKFLIDWCQLPMNVVFIAHETTDMNDTQSLTRPSFSPAIYEVVMKELDAMLYMTIETAIGGKMEVKGRRIRSMPTRSIRAKTRLMLPTEFDAEELWKLLEPTSSISTKQKVTAQ